MGVGSGLRVPGTQLLEAGQMHQPSVCGQGTGGSRGPWWV